MRRLGKDGREDVMIMEDKREKREKACLNRESGIKVDQLHLQIAHAWPWPALASL